MVECFGAGAGCAVIGACRLPAAIQGGLNAFLEVMDRTTLADVALPPAAFDPPAGRRSDVDRR